MRKLAACGLAVLLVGSGPLGFNSSASAATNVIAVTTTADSVDPNDGLTSLREAVGLANPSADPVLIALVPGATHTLDNCGLTIATTAPTTISGNGATIKITCATSPGISATASTSPLRLTDLTIEGAGILASVAILTERPLTASTVALSNARAGIVAPAADADVDLLRATISGTGTGITIGDVNGPTPPTAATARLRITESAIRDNASDYSSSGGIVGPRAQVTVARSTINGNTTRLGGVLAYDLTMTDSVVENNVGVVAGGMEVNGSALVRRSLVRANGGTLVGSSSYVGGFLGRGLIEDSTISDNDGTMIGGIASLGPLIIRNSTVSGNQGRIGGAGNLGTDSSIVIEDSTFSHNLGGQSPPLNPSTPPAHDLGTSFGDYATSVSVTRSVLGSAGPGVPTCLVADSTTTPPVPGSIASGGFTLAADDSCGDVGKAPGDMPNAGDPRLPPLADNGGPTPTHIPTTILRDRIPASVSRPLSDQRGIPRSAHSDIGAVDADYGPFYGLYNPITPNRIYDSRPIALPLGPGETRNILVDGLGGIPRYRASTVAVNVTVTNTTDTSHLSVWAAGGTPSATSSLNWDAGDTQANFVVASVGEGGAIAVRNNSGTAHVILDVVGWFEREYTPQSVGFTPLPPTRALDTRTTTPIGPGEQRSLVVAGLHGVPADAIAVAVTLTGVRPSFDTHLTAGAAGLPLPSVSQLNIPGGAVAANLAWIPIGAGGAITIGNNTGEVDVLVDIAGAFSETSNFRYQAVDGRWLDTRYSTPFGPGTTRRLVIGSHLLRERKVAVVGNAIIIRPSQETHLSLGPTPGPVSEVSNLNLDAGNIRAGAFTAALGPVYDYVPEGDFNPNSYRFDGILARNNAGQTDIVIDVQGWFVEPAGG